MPRRIHVRSSLGVLTTLFALAQHGSAAPLARQGVDDEHFRSLQQFSPVAADRLSRGESLLMTARTEGDVQKAITLFDEGIAAAPSSELIRRRKCQALSVLGRHADAVKACGEALHARTMSGLGLRATVGALMSGTEPPPGQEIGMAYVHASRARQVLPNEASGYAGQCDIAEKLGDRVMLEGCIRELARIAPGHQETKRAQSFLRATQPGIGTALAWLSLALSVVAAAAHALLSRRRAVPLAAALVAGVLAFPTSAHAATDDAPAASATSVPGEAPKVPKAGFLSKFTIDDTNPEASVPADDKRDADPVEFGYFIMDLADHAEWAIRDGDHLRAAHLYGALAKAVPDTAVGFVKACAEYETAKALDSAIQYCAASLTTKGITLADYSHYARLLLQKKALTATDITNLDSVVKHLAAQPGAAAVALDIECTLGAHESDRTRLEGCVPKLSAIAPNSPKVLFYQWALAMKNKDFASAEKVLAKARTEPGAKEQVAQMERATTAALPPWRRGFLAFRDWRVGVAFTMVLAAALSALLLRRRPASPAANV